MANHKSSEKRARQDKKKTMINSQTKSSVRTEEKKLRAAIEKKDKATASLLIKTFESRLAKASQKGLYHSNLVARKMSRLTLQINQLS